VIANPPRSCLVREAGSPRRPGNMTQVVITMGRWSPRALHWVDSRNGNGNGNQQEIPRAGVAGRSTTGAAPGPMGGGGDVRPHLRRTELSGYCSL
jgi:hypothetical protein